MSQVTTTRRNTVVRIDVPAKSNTTRIYHLLQYCKTGNDSVSAPALHSSAEGAMEAISHVDGHVGSSQLFKRLGIQEQEECPFILQRRRKISPSSDEFVLSSAKAGGSLYSSSSNSVLLGYLDCTAVFCSNSSPHYSLSDFFPVPTVPFPLYLAFSCDTF